MKYMTREQVLDLLQVAKDSSERDFVMILLAYRHGLRASEVCSLTTKNFSDGYITVKRLKGSEKTAQPLFSSENPLLDELTAVTAYLSTLPKSQKQLFPARQTSTTIAATISRQAFSALFKAYGQAAGIPAHLCHVHTSKHSIAMELVGKIGISELQAFLGHKSLNSTGMYLKVSQQQACDSVAKAMDF
jgi:type 1 fimbriae regulatory protein FimB